MKREQYQNHSTVLNQDMSMIAYGEGGIPVIAFQTEGASCNEFESVGMVDALADLIEGGQIQLFCVDGVDTQSWSAYDIDPEARAQRQEEYFSYVTSELLEEVQKVNGSTRRPLAIGCSLGANQAALAVLRRPDLFQGCIALSGLYRASRFFGSWMSPTLYDNDITTFLPNMPEDHEYVDLYSKRQLVFCVGQGEHEDVVDDLRQIDSQLSRLCASHWCDFWGFDVTHDWYWWKKQIAYFMPQVIDEVTKVTTAEKSAASASAAMPATAKATKKDAPKKAAAKTATKKVELKPEAKPASKAKATTAAKPAAKPAPKAKATAATKPAAAKPTAAATKPAAAAKPTAAAAKPAAKHAAKAAAPAAKPAAKPTAASKPTSVKSAKKGGSKKRK